MKRTTKLNRCRPSTNNSLQAMIIPCSLLAHVLQQQCQEQCRDQVVQTLERIILVEVNVHLLAIEIHLKGVPARARLNSDTGHGLGGARGSGSASNSLVGIRSLYVADAWAGFLSQTYD